jgi:hypothetical protein
MILAKHEQMHPVLFQTCRGVADLWKSVGSQGLGDKLCTSMSIKNIKLEGTMLSKSDFVSALAEICILVFLFGARDQFIES